MDIAEVVLRFDVDDGGGGLSCNEEVGIGLLRLQWRIGGGGVAELWLSPPRPPVATGLH